MREMCNWVMLVGIVLCTVTLPVSAHHSFAARYDMDKVIALYGTVVTIRLTNPHPTMDMDVTEKDGTKVRYLVTARASANALRDAGWTPATLPVGIIIKLEAHPALLPGSKTVCAGTVTMPDGKQISLGGTLGIQAS